MALNTMIDQLRASQKQLNAEAADAIATELAKLLPEGAHIEWDQYTDYWNDGEPCTFSVHEWTVHTKDGQRIDPYARRADEFTTMIMEIRDAWRLFERNEALFQSAFGDHVTVTVYADGRYKTEHCNHE